MSRVSIYRIPNEPTRCGSLTCVYNSHAKGCFDGGTCDEPRTNKGNSDAECHRWNNKYLLERLDEAKAFWAEVAMKRGVPK